MIATHIKAEYDRAGVVHRRAFLRPAELEELRAALERYREHVLPRLPKADYVLESDGESVRNFWRMHDHDDDFKQLMARPDFLELAASLVGGTPEPVGVEMFGKPARVGSVVPYHQDNAYFCRAPADVVSLWIAIDRVTPENGAVEYLLGSHRELLPHRPSGVHGNSFALADEPPAGRFERYQPSLEPGDALLHHSQTIHRSHPNTSERSRRSLVIVYRGTHTRHDLGLQAEYDRALAKIERN